MSNDGWKVVGRVRKKDGKASDYPKCDSEKPPQAILSVDETPVYTKNSGPPGWGTGAHNGSRSRRRVARQETSFEERLQEHLKAVESFRQQLLVTETFKSLLMAMETASDTMQNMEPFKIVKREGSLHYAQFCNSQLSHDLQISGVTSGPSSLADALDTNQSHEVTQQSRVHTTDKQRIEQHSIEQQFMCSISQPQYTSDDPVEDKRVSCLQSDDPVEDKRVSCLQSLQKDDDSDTLSRSSWCHVKHLVILGLGSPGSSRVSRAQLGFALCLWSLLPGLTAPPATFDPAYDDMDKALLNKLGIEVLEVNEGGRKAAGTPTMFYMPHCEHTLYEDLISHNKNNGLLRNVVLLGNSLKQYREAWRLTHRADRPSTLLSVVEEAGCCAEQSISCGESDAEPLGAFNNTSLHLFSCFPGEKQAGGTFCEAGEDEECFLGNP
ncbi:hypothetical protein CEUSTIGMA_g4594.t1 [Chlamydomonas eustigma]|uniref:SRR1-like domain-containing protein n=1 Tax=Chlamydomonas eustigma TaxID=1157962 RepID=A0A250X253_9CHLO|nr:hypothetical protein CEUSTIGMA_g4594.t1 [Chlamydomonas eustigma]|eukprot:GAX77148.1 hypothetical protein CEUSTIGMA_g4594.t1 [Chlamydomonas eustigma]